HLQPVGEVISSADAETPVGIGVDLRTAIEVDVVTVLGVHVEDEFPRPGAILREYRWRNGNHQHHPRQQRPAFHGESPPEMTARSLAPHATMRPPPRLL